MMIPLAAGETLASPKAILILVERCATYFRADLHSVFTIYPSPTQRDPERWEKLKNSLQSRAIAALRSIRVEPHDQREHCLVHSPGFCLSTLSGPGP